MRPRPRAGALVLSALLVAGCGATAAAPVSQPTAGSAATTTAPATQAEHDATAVHPAGRSAAAKPVAGSAARRQLSRAADLRSALADTAADAAQPCGRVAGSPDGYQHVVWIWLENRSYGTVIGGPGTSARRQAPYLNRLADSCGLATNYHNVSHPSQPNYFAAVAGITGNVTTNCEPSTCSLPGVTTLFSQVTSSGRQWRSYEQSMPQPCVAKNDGRYVDRHNPDVYFPADAAQCQAWDVPMGTTSGGALVDALSSDTLPAFSFITPDVCEDMHSCRTRTGDDWLAEWVPRIIASPGYEQGNTAVFITFDEGEGGHTNNCATNTIDVGCHIPTVVISPSTPQGTRSAVLFNHYSLLKTTEQLLGIRQLLGHAADADTRSMVTAFGL